MQYSHYDLNPHYISEKEMQYPHKNLMMHIVCGVKMQYSHFNLNPHYMGEGNAILAWQFQDANYMWVEKCNIGITTLNPHYL